jgi:hypothetical protein
MRRFDDWIDAYMEFTENSEPPHLFKEWVAISAIASVLERKVVLNWGEITLYPNMYIVLVGSSGRTRKGTAMGPGYNLLRQIGVKMAAESITREALIRELKKANTNTTNPETQVMMFHSSMTIFSPELTVFLGYNNQQLMADLADWYDCRDKWTYRTKSQGTDEITGVFVNMIGATTPDLLQTTLPQDAIGGGLTSRIIFIFEDKKGKLVPAPFLTDKQRDMKENVLADLQQISMMTGDFKFTGDFMDHWIDWYVMQDKHSPFKDDGAFDGYVSRRPTHVLKLCMILNASRTDSMMITPDDLHRAIDLLERTEIKMPRVFSGVGTSDISMVMGKVTNIVAQKGDIDYRDLLRLTLRDADKETLDRVVATLEAVGTVAIIKNIEQGTVTIRHIPTERK